MNRSVFALAALLIFSATLFVQSPKAATYITDEQVKAVNASPGVDRQLVSVDIGKLNEAVGIIHRGPTGAPAAGRGTAAAPAAAAIPPAQLCGEQGSPPAGAATGIEHDHQTA